MTTVVVESHCIIATVITAESGGTQDVVCDALTQEWPLPVLYYKLS